MGTKLKQSIKFRLRPEEVQELEAKKDDLAAQAKRLQLANGRLQLRFDMLYGTFIAIRQAASFLRSPAAAQTGSNGSRSGQYARLVAENLQQLISAEMNVPADLLEDPFKRYCPPRPSPGIAPALIQSFINRKCIDGPLHRSILNGMPLSFMHSCMLCALYDPAVTDEVQKVWYGGAPAIQAWLDCLHSDLLQLMQLKPSMDHAPAPEVLCAIAVRIVHAMSISTANSLLFSMREKHIAVRRSAQGDEGFPPDALLDKVTEQVALSQHQLKQISQLLEVFQELQAPLAQQKAEITARISHMLSHGLGMMHLANGAAAAVGEGAAAGRLGGQAAGGAAGVGGGGAGGYSR